MLFKENFLIIILKEFKCPMIISFLIMNLLFGFVEIFE
jgi:hypothetical protein